LALGLLLVTASAALAWPEGPFTEVNISGPGIDGTATITGAGLGGMTLDNFTDYSTAIAAPTQLGAAYELHRHFIHESGQPWDFDRVIYYFDPAGGPGYVFYAQAIGYGPSHHQGRWFRATGQSVEIMRGILTPLGAWSAAVAATGGAFAEKEAAASRPDAAVPAIRSLPTTVYAVAAITALAAAGMLLYTGKRRHGVTSVPRAASSGGRWEGRPWTPNRSVPDGATPPVLISSQGRRFFGSLACTQSAICRSVFPMG
jgi:hypothetical protein